MLCAKLSKSFKTESLNFLPGKNDLKLKVEQFQIKMCENKDPVITTTHGRVRGMQKTSIYGDQYYCFDGIPYAKPPIAQLRFKAPEELEAPWQGVRDCTTIPTKSLQYNRYKQQKEGGEDCLYLNINVKKLQSAKPLPIMVYIHGGGFNTGDATRESWGPDYFMMQDVVFITIGYRLGSLGFMCFSDPTLQIPGNAGLKDLVLALRWIKNNCANFNGDPENITLLGHSSGGIATHFLMLAPQCKDLFHKAVLMSGFCFNFQHEEHLPYRLACVLGYKGENIDRNVYEYLMQLDAAALVGFKFWSQEELDKGYKYEFMPTIEPYETSDTIFTKDPVEVLRTAWSNDIPLMLGSTSFEGLLNYKYYTKNSGIYDTFREHPEYLLPQELLLKCNLAMQKKLGKEIVEIFFATKKLDVENAYSALHLTSFTFIYHSLHRTLQSRLNYSSAPSFLYRFDFDSPNFNLYRLKHCGPGVRGVSHVDDLSYIFLMPTSYKLPAQSSEYKTIVRMIHIWTTFAAKSDPNTDLIRPAVWRPVERNGTYKCMNISDKTQFIDLPEQDKCKLMDKLYKQAGLDLY